MSALGSTVAISPPTAVCKLLAHGDFMTDVLNGAPASSEAAHARVGAYQHEAIAHGRNHAVRGIPSGRDGANDSEPSFPGERLAAIGADVALPAAVIDFSYGRQHRAANFAIGRQDRRHVLDHQ